MAIRRVTPILLVTGFLGSGKTTMLAHWLKSPALAGAMVIINEFGEVGIDDRLIQSSGEMPVMLENGCACCTAGEDLAETLERLYWEQLQREIPPMSWVLIETTGLADPRLILDRLAHHPVLSERYSVAGVVTTFDARRGPAQIEAYQECQSQLEHASLVIMTKLDLASADELAAAHAAVRGIAPDVAILESAGASLAVEAAIAALGEPARAFRHAAPAHAHDPHEAHAHAHHSAALNTAFLPLSAAVDRIVLRQACLEAKAAFGPGLLRLKGIVALGAAEALHSAQLEGDDEVIIAPLPHLAGGAPRLGFTIIAQHAESQKIATFLAGLLNAHTVAV